MAQSGSPSTSPALPANNNEAFDALVRRSHAEANRTRRNGQPEVQSPLETAIRQAGNDNPNGRALSATMLELVRDRIGGRELAAQTEVRSGNPIREHAGRGTIAALPQQSADLVYLMTQVGNVPGLENIIRNPSADTRTALANGLMRGTNGNPVVTLQANDRGMAVKDDQVLILGYLSNGVSPTAIANTHREAVRALPADASEEQRSNAVVAALRARNFTAYPTSNTPFTLMVGREANDAIRAATGVERTSLRRGGVNSRIAPAQRSQQRSELGEAERPAIAMDVTEVSPGALFTAALAPMNTSADPSQIPGRPRTM